MSETNGVKALNGSDDALRQIRTAQSITISPELFEKIYLSPQNNVKGDLRKTFGNPTPVAICGFIMSLTPLSCDLMGWRGASPTGSAGIGTYMLFGGILMLLGGIGEWVLGNTFPCVVFGSFGAFWFSFGLTLQPQTGAYGNFATNPDNPASGLATVEFNSSWAFFMLAMAMLCFVFLVCGLRTNITFVVIFFTLVLTFSLLAANYWQTSNGNTDMAAKLVTAAGACAFVTSLAGWWLFSAIMLAALDFPVQVPVGDLSRLIKGASDKARERDQRAERSA